MAVNAAGITVLCVDDDSSFAERTATALEDQDAQFSVRTVATPSEALERLRTTDVACVVSGYDLPEMDGLDFLEAVRDRHPDLPFVLFTGAGDEAVASRAISAGVTDYVRRDAERDSAETLARRIRAAVDGHRARVRRAQRDQRLRLFEQAVESSGHSIYFTDRGGTITYVNPAFEETTGYTAEEAVGATPRILKSGEHGPAFYEDLWDTILSGDVWRSEIVNETKTGEQYVADQTIAPVPGDDGAIDHFVAVNVDITDRKEHEQQLRTLNEATRELLAADENERVAQLVAAAANRILGYASTVVRFKDGDLLRPVAVTERARAEMGVRPVYATDSDNPAGRAYTTGEPLQVDDVRAVDDSHDRGDARAAMYLPLGEHGVLSVVDTTVGAFDQSDLELASVLAAGAETAIDRVDHERELERQNERLEEFAGVVSHDLRNPLNVAQGWLSTVQSEEYADELERVGDALDRMEAIIDDTLTLAREGKTVAEKEPIDIAQLAGECWKMVATADSGIVIDDEFQIRGDRDRLQHLFENLFRNAVEHGSTTPDAPGRQNADERGREGVTISIGLVDDGFYVEDDGPGIPEDERDRVFDPGHTTASDGTGFGLTIVREIADAHGWDVTVTESEQGGARFEFTNVERRYEDAASPRRRR